jgi:hypothetical protein
MSGPSEREPAVNNSDLQSDGRDLLLEEVNFKWLMAGMGWWVDMVRFHSDPPYARHFLALAAASDSPALRDCAISLQSRNEIACQ